VEARRASWSPDTATRTRYFWGAPGAYDADRAASKLAGQGWVVTVSVSDQTVAFVNARSVTL
jgi:hypothetical protein